MERWLLTLTLIAAVQCHILSNGDTMTVTTVLGGAVTVKLDYPGDGLPIPNCCCNVDLLQQPVLTGAVVTEIAQLNDLGHLLRLDFVDNIVTCHLVPFVKDTDILSSTLCPHLACPPGWNLLQETCFLITQDSGSWEEGRSFCHQLGGSLATISSEVQQNALSHMLTGDTWIGLRYLHSKRKLFWDEGNDHRYSRWAQGQPNTAEALDSKGCVDMRQTYNFLWNTANCHHSKRFLCSVHGTAITDVSRAFNKTKRSDKSIPTASSTTTTTTAAPTAATTTTAAPTTATTPTTTSTTTTSHVPECESGWIRFQSSCYKLFTESLNYTMAESVCSDHGAYPTIIGNEDEDLFLRDLIKEDTFIGLTDLEEEGTFVWRDGSSLSFTRWHEDEPNDYKTSEDCVELRKTTSFEWNDINCNYLKNFVCEKTPQ